VRAAEWTVVVLTAVSRVAMPAVQRLIEHSLFDTTVLSSTETTRAEPGFGRWKLDLHLWTEKGFGAQWQVDSEDTPARGVV
jgi:hypothetical protein